MSTSPQPATGIASPAIRAVSYLYASADNTGGAPTTDSQRAAIQAYAAPHGISVIREYCDAAGADDAPDGQRPAYHRLLHDLRDAPVECAYVLIADWSRWPRCRELGEVITAADVLERAGITVLAVAQTADGDEAANEVAFYAEMVQLVKRYMAAEQAYGHAARARAGAARRAGLGAHLGGKAGFGFRRMLVDRHGTYLGLLEDGARKTQPDQYIVLVPGPDAEIALVNWMYWQVADEHRTPGQLVQMLAQRNAMTDRGRPWTRAAVLTVLTSPRYIGTLVYNRTTSHLGTRRRRTADADVLRVPEAFAGIVPVELYHRVQTALAAPGRVGR